MKIGKFNKFIDNNIVNKNYLFKNIKELSTVNISIIIEDCNLSDKFILRVFRKKDDEIINIIEQYKYGGINNNFKVIEDFKIKKFERNHNYLEEENYSSFKKNESIYFELLKDEEVLASDEILLLQKNKFKICLFLLLFLSILFSFLFYYYKENRFKFNSKQEIILEDYIEMENSKSICNFNLSNYTDNNIRLTVYLGDKEDNSKVLYKNNFIPKYSEFIGDFIYMNLEKGNYDIFILIENIEDKTISNFNSKLNILN